jgi:hypothetical protein
VWSPSATKPLSNVFHAKLPEVFTQVFTAPAHGAGTTWRQPHATAIGARKHTSAIAAEGIWLRLQQHGEGNGV